MRLFLKSVFTLLFMAVLVIPAQVDAQSRKRVTKRKTTTTTTTTTIVTQTNSIFAKESSSIGTMTVYYAANSIRDLTNEPFEKGDVITNSNNPLTRFDSKNKTTYQYTFADDGDMYSTSIAKSRIDAKQYEMSPLPVSLVGDRIVFKSADGSTARIFRSTNNGHSFLDKNGKKLPDFVNQSMDGCYVLSVVSKQKWGDDYELFEEQLEVNDGNIQLYMVPDYSKTASKQARLKHHVVGLVTDKWGPVDQWAYNKSSYDQNGKLLMDQIKVSSGRISEDYQDDDYCKYCTIAYIADLDALFINDKFYYRERENDNTHKTASIETDDPDDHIFKSVDQSPAFPGGEAALMKYLSSHLQYPTMAQENNVQGRVVVQFVVEKNGSVGEVKVVRSVDPDLDKEAIRLCKSLPKFIPGRHQGKVVRVWYTLPFSFRLQGASCGQ